MESQTCVASTKDWLEASKEMKIKLSVENSISTVNAYRFAVSLGELLDTLKQISLPFLGRPSVVVEPSLDLEFEAWDSLSDEALVNFEYALE